MPLRSIFFLLFSILLSTTMRSQNDAPVTMAGFVVNQGPNVVIPVTVTDFVDIGAISLTMDYNYSIVQISGISFNVNLPGFTADWTTNPGRIIMGWYGSSGVTLPDGAHIADISFTGLVAGGTALAWIDDGGSCEYAKFDGGAFNVLNDSPTSEYYKNGQITYNQYGPVTVAPVYFPSAPNQDICVPIKIYQGTNIGAISLTLDYDPAVLIFQSINSATVSWPLSGQSVNPGRLIVGGYGPGISLPDGAVLFNACFHYNSGGSALAWWDENGTACEYADSVNFNPFYDLPQSTYYIDGYIGSSPIAADFIADNVTPPRNTTVTFTDLSPGNPTSWEWSFDRTSVVYVNGTSANSRNPQVQFTEGGLYTVTLVAHYGGYTCNKVKVDYIRAGTPGYWTGANSSSWLTSTNWDDWRVPDNLIDVLIPSAAPYWPIYDGDLTIGVQCKTITLEAITSQLTITGDLIIP